MGIETSNIMSWLGLGLGYDYFNPMIKLTSSVCYIIYA